MTTHWIEQRRCDRCGHSAIGPDLDGWAAILPKRRTAAGPVNITPTGFAPVIDLCAMCLETLGMWLTGTDWRTVDQGKWPMVTPADNPVARTAVNFPRHQP